MDVELITPPLVINITPPTPPASPSIGIAVHMKNDITLLYPPAQQYRRRESHRKKQCARRRQGQGPESPTTPIPVIADVEELWKQEAEEWAESARHFKMRIEEEGVKRDMQREGEDKEGWEREARIWAVEAEDGWDRCGDDLLDIYGAMDSFPAYDDEYASLILAAEEGEREVFFAYDDEYALDLLLDEEFGTACRDELQGQGSSCMTKERET